MRQVLSAEWGVCFHLEWGHPAFREMQIQDLCRALGSKKQHIQVFRSSFQNCIQSKILLFSECWITILMNRSPLCSEAPALILVKCANFLGCLQPILLCKSLTDLLFLTMVSKRLLWLYLKPAFKILGAMELQLSLSYNCFQAFQMDS